MVTSNKRLSPLPQIKSMLLWGAKGKDPGLEYRREEICSAEKGLLWGSTNAPGLCKQITDLSAHPRGCMEHWTAVHCFVISQLCLSVRGVKSPPLNSWAILSVHGVSFCSLKQVWDHFSRAFLPCCAKLLHCLLLPTGQEHSRGQSSA